MAVFTRSSVIVIFAFFSLFLTIGFANSCGVFYSDWVSDFEGDSEWAVAVATSLNAGFYLGAGPVVAVICEHMGFRCGIVLGVIFTSAGAMGTSFSKNAVHLAFSFGVAMGFGEALIFVPMVALVALHNPTCTRRATSIALIGIAVGMIVFPVAYKAVSRLYSWKGIMFIYSGVLLNLFAVAALDSQPKNTETTVQLTSAGEPPSTGQTQRKTIFQKVLYLLRWPEIYLHFFAEFCWNFGISVMFILSPQYASTAIKANKDIFVFFIGIGTLVGRLLSSLWDYVPFCRKVPSWFLFALATGLSAVPVGIYSFGTSMTFFGSCNFAVGMFYGMIVCCQSSMYAEFMGIELLVVMIGFSYLFNGLGYLMGSPIVIAIRNATGKAEYTFYITASSYAIGSIATVTVPLIQRWRYQCNIPGTSASAS